VYLSIEDEDYWKNPGRLAKLENPINFAARDIPETPYMKLLRQVRATHFVLGDPDDDEAPAAIVLRLPPMLALPYHAHASDIFMVVIKGSLHVPGRVLLPGDAQTAKANEFYGPEVAGPDGCTRVEFFSRLHGSTHVEYKLPDGGTLTFDALGDAPGPRGLGMDDVPPLVEAVRLAAEARGR
jgi:hypothetical protein